MPAAPPRAVSPTTSTCTDRSPGFETTTPPARVVPDGVAGTTQLSAGMAVTASKATVTVCSPTSSTATRETTTPTPSAVRRTIGPSTAGVAGWVGCDDAPAVVPRAAVAGSSIALTSPAGTCSVTPTGALP